MKKGSITRSTGFQIMLYFVLAAGFLVGCLCSFATAWMWGQGAYTETSEEYFEGALRQPVYRHFSYIVGDKDSFPTMNDIIEGLRYESEDSNLTFRIVRVRDNKEIWSNVENDGATMEFSSFCYRGEQLMAEEYIVSACLDMRFPVDDELGQEFERARTLREYRNLFPCGAGGGILLCVISFLWLMCNAGHRRGREGITPGVLSNIYLDVLSVFFGVVALMLFVAVVAIVDGRTSVAWIGLAVSVGGMLEVVWCTIYLREFALRMKLGKWWRHSLIFVVCRLVCRTLAGLWRMLVRLLAGLPAILPVAGAVLFFSFCEFVGIGLWGEAELFACWLLEKIVLVPVILYCALAFCRLQKGSRALADGDLSGKIKTDYLILQFRELGENLNRIQEGISRAVEQRLQSERLKTELITNVSHDLKTPLTSIINYADLLGNVALSAEQAESEADRGEKVAQMQEYSEVLLRQSGRLKKLLDDLVEASKATTGNLEVNPAPCELGVLLTQMAGEYEEKLAGKQLALHICKPEEEIRILADGRHLWRVFDNLMSNICKYAQEGSRVYLNMEQRDGRVEIIFRNMSKYELHISPGELSERFVRGDASRHMEGSGLGLSIAKSLVELQKGEMEILTDGDLFKVILRFHVLESGQ